MSSIKYEIYKKLYAEVTPDKAIELGGVEPTVFTICEAINKALHGLPAYQRSEEDIMIQTRKILNASGVIA